MRVLLTGGGGMLGASIQQAWTIVRPNDVLVSMTRDDVDLRDRRATQQAFSKISPDIVIHAAAFVHGIAAKQAYPTSYLLDNLLIDTSVISASLECGTLQFLYIGSAAAYPENGPQPLKESSLLTGQLERLNEGYGLAKLSGMKLCQYISEELGLAYRAVVPSNLYGPHDNYSSFHGHLIAAAIAKVDKAHRRGDSAVTIWGDGRSRREFTYVRDLAEWILSQLGELDSLPVLLNLGAGLDYPVDHFYEVARDIVGYRGAFEHDLSKPNGTRSRLLDSSLAIERGWSPQTAIQDGMAECYQAYLDQRSTDVGI